MQMEVMNMKYVLSKQCSFNRNKDSLIGYTNLSFRNGVWVPQYHLNVDDSLNIFSGSIYIKQTTALFFVSFFNEGLSIIRCNSWNLQSLISRCSNIFFQWEVNLLLSNVTFNVVLQTLAVKGYLNM